MLHVQADSLPYLKTRLATPLFSCEQAPHPLMTTLNAVSRLDGDDVAMMTQYGRSICC